MNGSSDAPEGAEASTDLFDKPMLHSRGLIRHRQAIRLAIGCFVFIVVYGMPERSQVLPGVALKGVVESGFHSSSHLHASSESVTSSGQSRSSTY